VILHNNKSPGSFEGAEYLKGLAPHTGRISNFCGGVFLWASRISFDYVGERDRSDRMSAPFHFRTHLRCPGEARRFIHVIGVRSFQEDGIRIDTIPKPSA
jgi:hypothetical protein